MAIMVMDMVQTPNKRCAKFHYLPVIALLATMPHTAMAGKWTFDPNVSIDETYTDNVELEKNNPVSSFVNQSSIGLNSKFESKLAQFSFKGTGTYVTYSHDSQLNDSYRTLSSNARYALWSNGPALIANVTIANQSKNGANNGLADLVSADTVETINYQAGLEYNLTHSLYSLNSSIRYQIRRADDNIGESNGYVANIKANNGNASRDFLWQINANYTERHNNNLTGRIHNVEALAGMITSSGFSPFVRLYSEDSTGNFNTNRNTNTASWGPGVRWRISKHFYVDLSYNYVDDKTKSDNYIATSINWQPSPRTSLEAGYNKRFFGNAYNLNFQHKIKRLTNNIRYNETVQAFDRNTFRQVSLGNFWCPIDADINTDVSACFVGSNSDINFNDYQLITVFDQELVQGNEFSLNKTLSWQSQLALARTTFSLNLSGNERESLTTNRKEQNVNASLSASRKISGKSDVKLSVNFRHQQFDRNNVEGNGQEDYYRTVTTTYTRKLARSLSTNMSVQYLDRNSTQGSRTYQETRAIIKITKEF